MISTFLQMRTENRRAGFSRAIAGLCVVLWLAGSVSTLYGSLTPQWTTLHCPQSHSNSAQHTHGSCAWHCDSIDSQSFSGRSWRPSITQQDSSPDPSVPHRIPPYLTAGSPAGGRLVRVYLHSISDITKQLPTRRPTQVSKKRMAI